jgi:predicted small lipoprotein YifL
MRRSILALLAAGAVVATLAGCGLRGGRDEPAPAPTPTPSATQSTVTSTADLDDILADLDAFDTTLDQVSSDVSDGEAAEGQED